MLRTPQASEHPWIAVEGWKAIQDLLQDHRASLLLHHSDVSQERLQEALPFCDETAEVTRPLFRKLSEVKTPQGFLAFFKKPLWRRQDLSRVVLYVDGLQDPGNLGTLIRTAQAVSASIVTGPGCVSRFNPKVVRAAAGALFSTAVLEAVPADRLSEWGYSVWAADPRHGADLFQAPLQAPLAVVIGAEGGGIASSVLDALPLKLRVPMAEGCQSLNAAVAGAVILYECVRRGLLPVSSQGESH